MLPLSAGRVRILGLLQRVRSADFSDLERLGCCGRMIGNLESEMLAKMWEMQRSMGWVEERFKGSCWLWGLNRERLGWWVV